MTDWLWVGEGPATVHAVHRRDVREEGNRVCQSLCKVAALAYSPENQPRLPRRKLCGNCKRRLAQLDGQPAQATGSVGRTGLRFAPTASAATQHANTHGETAAEVAYKAPLPSTMQ